MAIAQTQESEVFDFVGSFVPSFEYIWQKVIITSFFTDFLVCKREAKMLGECLAPQGKMLLQHRMSVAVLCHHSCS